MRDDSPWMPPGDDGGQIPGGSSIQRAPTTVPDLPPPAPGVPTPPVAERSDDRAQPLVPPAPTGGASIAPDAWSPKVRSPGFVAPDASVDRAPSVVPPPPDGASIAPSAWSPKVRSPGFAAPDASVDGAPSVVPPPPDGASIAPDAWSPAAEVGASGFAAPDAPDARDAPDAPDVVVRSSEPDLRPRRSKWVVGAAAAAVVALGVAGIFAVSNLTGASAGGAASPEELGLGLLRAIEDEDVLGVIDVLAPGERDVFRDPLVDLVSELTRLEILSEDADLSRILGVDVDFSNEVVAVTSTNVPDIANIDLRADAVVTVDGSQIPIGALVTDNLDDDMLTEMRGTRTTETDELDVRLTAVEEDGRWYFSVFHTIAELARNDLAPSSLIPVEGIGADGADTPDAAVDALLDRVEALDLTGLLRTLDPGEAAALQRYAPLFLDSAEAALDDVPLEWEITRRAFRVEESGDEATVFVDAIAIEGVAEDGSFTFEFADGCLSAEASGETFEQCTGAAFDDAEDVFAEFPETERLIETVTEAFADIEQVGLELRRTDGRWYVSPMATTTESILAFVRALDRSELDAIIEQVPAAGDEFVDAIFGGLNDLPGSFDDSDVEDVGDGAAPAPTVPGVDPGAATDGQDCYSVIEPDAASACFRTAVERGEMDHSWVPLELRYPECGYAIAWGSDFYRLPDDEFIAAVEAARPCFLDLVERGEVSEYELPTEIAHLECFEGRNWYNVFDDPEYDARYDACLSAAYEG